MILKRFPKAISVIADRTRGHGNRKTTPPSHPHSFAWPLNDLQVVSGSYPRIPIPEGPGKSRLSSLSMEQTEQKASGAGRDEQ